jgi:hypothetical protein
MSKLSLALPSVALRGHPRRYGKTKTESEKTNSVFGATKSDFVPPQGVKKARGWSVAVTPHPLLWRLP